MMVARRQQPSEPAAPPPEVNLGANSGADRELLSYVERIERLTEEISGLTDDRKEVFGEVKARGFDTKILRQVIQRRKPDAADRAEHDSLLDLYEEAVCRAEKKALEQSEADGT